MRQKHGETGNDNREGQVAPSGAECAAALALVGAAGTVSCHVEKVRQGTHHNCTLEIAPHAHMPISARRNPASGPVPSTGSAGDSCTVLRVLA